MLNKQLTLGSLFAGIGAFETAAAECGITPKWNCEIEPYCRLVLNARFPATKQYGDICKLDGGKVEPVDIITFGSPCQSFSVAAGDRKGLGGASGLFFEAVRIIREMRKATGNKYPRYAVMENVPGIYSSKTKGQSQSDFGVVLNELIHIKDETVTIPEPPRGKWENAGFILGDTYSLAWRTIDASQFGVAQRRRRMYLVVSFDDGRAGEILSEQEGERRHFTPSYLKGQDPARASANGSGSVSVLNDQGGAFMGVTENVTSTLRSQEHGHQPLVFEPGAASRLGGHAWEGMPTGALRADMGDNQLAVAIENHPADSRVKISGDGKVQTLSGRMGTGGGNVPLVMNERQYALTIGEDTANTLTGSDYKGAQCVFEPRAYGICSYQSNSMKSKNPESGIYEADTSRTLDTSVPDPNKNAGGMAVVALEGNLTRPSHKGDGYRKDVSYTLNTVENHAVCYQETVGALCASDYKGIRNQDIGEDKAVVTYGNNGHGKWNAKPAMLKASGGDYPGGENMVVESRYAVRRLTPTECLRLQGLPDGHLSGIHIEEPTEADIDYWYEVFEANRKALGKTTRPRSRNMVAKWLCDPHSDSAAYRAIGNSLAVPCAMFVLGGIVYRAGKTP